MISKLKILIKYIIYYLINLLISSKKIKGKSLLIIRLDAIGDYVLFRNFLSIIKNSEEYKEYHITLVGNSAWKSVALELDSEFVDTFIWIDRNKFDNSFVYLYKKLKELASNKYDVILNPTYSREFFYTDNLVKLISAQKKIGHVGDLSLMTNFQKQIGDSYYTELIETTLDIEFEFNRNKDFFEKVLNQLILIEKPEIVLSVKNIKLDLPENYIVLFIGGSVKFKKWDIAKYVQVGKYLKEHYSYSLVLCGGPNDIEDGLEFKKYYTENFVDLVGKTSLVELLYVLSHSKLMVSNETSAPHFALALNVQQVFVLSNGEKYGRFTPYPEGIGKNYHAIYPPEIEKNLNNYEYLCAYYGLRSILDINQITVDLVIKKIDKVLK